MGDIVVIDKRQKARDMMKDIMGEVISEAVATLKTEIKAEQDTFRTEIIEALPPTRKIRFDASEAKAPFITSGKVGDRGGYSFRRTIQAQLFKNWKLAKNEWGVHEMLMKMGMGDLGGDEAVDPGFWITPLCSDYLPEGIGSDIKSLLREGAPEVSAKDIQAIIRKTLGIGNDNLGGYLQEPQQAPEIIDLLRAQVVVQRAGATEIPLPPSGQLDWPRLTGDVQAVWVGESENLNTRITQNATFGALLLRAKKLASFQKISRELILFSAPAVETIIRSTMAQQIGLKEDHTWLQGAGTQATPMGMITTPAITAYTATTTGANGDTFEAQDVQLLTAEVGENNGVFEGWIMRPQMHGVIVTRRANQGTANAGAFLFDIVRSVDAKVPTLLAGYPVWQSTQVSGARIKGSGTTLSYILGGMFSQCVIGRAGTLEIRTTDVGGTSFEQDEVWIRGISRVDFGMKVPAAVCFCDNLLQS